MIGRKYIAKIKIPSEIIKKSTGFIGESIFEYWFNQNYNGETLHKQAADRDYQKIDFADSKGYTYQVKATKSKSFTFNCNAENIGRHLNSNFYIFVQIKGEYAYIEEIKSKDYIANCIIKSYNAPAQSCFVYAEILNQEILNI